jgi:CBS domain containing-hemolysin-like protein
MIMEEIIVDGIGYFALLVLLVLSFYFSLTETAFTALNRIRIKNMAEKGSKRARLTLALYDDFDKLLSTLLVGTNISNITSAAICTVLLVNAFGDIGATLSAAATTVVVLIFAEVTPKNLAKESPEKIALFCAPLARFFMILFTPINAFFALWKKGLMRVFKTSAKDRTMTEDELISFVEEAKNIGVIDEGDKKLIQNIIEYYDQKAENVLTPRVDMVTISKDASSEEISALFFETGFSRIPVYDKSIDNIIGILHTKDFFRYVVKNDMPFESVISPVVFVPSLMDIGDLFNLLQKKKNHMAIVVDEYGGTDGLVTMEDILEELMGEIWDESDKVIEPFTEIEKNKYRVICSADTHEFFEYFDLPEEDVEKLPTTVNGWVVHMLDKIPEQGDTFKYENLTINVSKTERKRTLECIVTVEEEALVNDIV